MTEQAAIQAAWTEIATGYDEYVTPSNMALAERALQRAGLRPGMQVLDVAAGSGGLSIPAARARAQVLATDISPAMVERLEARAREEGLTDLKTRVMDGQALDLEDDTFDVAASQFGVMLFPDLPRGLSEMTRVTRPGGRVLLITMGPPTEVEFLEFFIGAVKTAVPDFTGLPRDPPPLPFQVSDPEALRAELADAGLADIRVETANHRLEFESGSQMWKWVTASNPIGAEMVADLTAEQKAAAEKSLDDKLRERSSGHDPAVLNNLVNIALGTK
ncbi:class I SAM-dependent methyltransferase [Natronorubrum aibiense]|uniref:Methyltransferase domain-containing protein n=1 Tax=Natronorubrum aibiense TaxID=348826 RepID=A0A5P9P8X8_9EURY|nr:methyltransferase domain-containing protein [Natronorubrum aibiense]QFU84340.1 methyltransferase domain-containing protein [Natronorubrum aibiense]